MKRRRRRKADDKAVDRAQVVADVADKFGMWEHDVVRFPRLFKGTGIRPASVTHGEVQRARTINRNAVDVLIEKYGANKPTRPATPDTSDEYVDDSKPVKRRRKLFDHSLVQIIRWMGSDNWSLTEAMGVFEQMGIEVKRGTVRQQLKRGADGERGAKLNEWQQDQLYAALEKCLAE